MAKQDTPQTMPLRQKYETEVRSALQEELGINNPMAIPNLEKIVINVGAGKAKDDSSILTEMEEIVATISGQKPIVTKAKIAVSNFKIRENMPIGLKVTLRRERMWFFLDKLINITLPRTKDFRGVNYKSFDGRGNYSLGMEDQTIFPEVDTTKNNRLHGLQISIITTATDDKSGYALLEKLGFPFKKGAKFDKQ